MGSFSDIANVAGVSYTDWSWASLLVDLDNDSDIEYTPSYNPVTVKKTIKYHTDIYTSESELARTNIYCYNCCHPFYNKPFALPVAVFTICASQSSLTDLLTVKV